MSSACTTLANRLSDQIYDHKGARVFRGRLFFANLGGQLTIYQELVVVPPMTNRLPRVSIARPVLLAALFVALAGCGGGGASMDAAPEAPIVSFDYISTPINFAPDSFSTTSLLSNGTVTTTNTSISFDESNDYATASAQVNGANIALTRSSETTWASTDGSFRANVIEDLPRLSGANDVYFLSLTNASGDVFVTTDGLNKGAPLSSGSATYNGVIGFFQHHGRLVRIFGGHVSRLANFGV